MKKNSEIIYSHEHTTIDLSRIKKDDDCNLNNKEQTLEAFIELKEKNVSTIIDMTNRGMGRDVTYVDNVSKESGIRIIHATGYYKEPFLPPEVYKLDETQLSKILINDITRGIDNTDIKASVIGEIGTSLNKIEDMERKVFKAACRAQIETGVPIVTHTTLGKLGHEQIEIFNEFKIDLDKIILSHIDLNEELEYVKSILDKGVNIAFDTIGKINYKPDEKRVEWIKELCEMGYSNQIILSMDITRKSHFKENGGIGYSYLIDSFLPMLHEAKIEDEHIENMICNNIKKIYKGLI